MRTVLIAAAIAVALATAQQCATNVDANTALPCTSTSSCTEADFNRDITVYSNNSILLNRYRMCIQGPSTPTQPNGVCCVDNCAVQDSSSCISAGCALIPGRGTASLCIGRNKLCGLLTGAQCTYYSFCNRTSPTSPCRFQGPKAINVAPGPSVADSCPALHPLVVAMLALMFITFVGAVVIVGIVVWRNQKKADEEEARREAAEAAAAEAKRQRQSRNGVNRL